MKEKKRNFLFILQSKLKNEKKIETIMNVYDVFCC
jgi:hypothetical protein